MSEVNKRVYTNPMDIQEYTGIPYGLIQKEYQEEISGIYGSKLLQNLGRIIGYYNVYDEGAEFFTEGSNGDYVPADLRYQRSANLIDKQARFAFGRPAEFIVAPADADDDSDAAKAAVSVLQDLIDSVMEQGSFSDKCLKGFKDACIGERVAVALDFNPEGISIKFLPSYSFIYEKDAYERLVKLVTFYTITDSENKNEQRIYKKKWWMENGKCHVIEMVYNGAGDIVDDPVEIVTKFSYLPCWVILNDGLTGDDNGVSDIARLQNYEEWYSKLANADIDAGRQGMNPVRWARDMSPASTENLSIAAGAFWDLASSEDLEDGKSGDVGVLETGMNYSAPLSNTLDRLATEMNSALDVPNINADSMSGVITSGKTLKAIYWPLQMRCDEKMIAWKPALRFIANTIIEGARLYPDSARSYISEPVPTIEYTLSVDNPYSLPEDETEEMSVDLQQVNAQTMSRKTYIKKWQQLTDKEADRELEQIVREQQLLESGMMQPMMGAAGQPINDGTDDDSGGNGDFDGSDFLEPEDEADEDDSDPELDALFKELDDLGKGL